MTDDQTQKAAKTKRSHKATDKAVPKHAYRCAIVHSLGDPTEIGIDVSYRYFADGLLVVEDGHIQAIGDAASLLQTLEADTPVTHYRDALMIPGMVDAHIHYPQTGMIGSYGEQLLDWLNRYTFPTERRFAERAHADQVTALFLSELLRNGTTTAAVFATIHPASVDAFFAAAEKCHLRMIAGKVLMDRNAPDYLIDSMDTGYRDSKTLIERWHGHDRLHYAVTPRFAPTSSEAQLEMAGQLLAEYPGLYLHTHLCENLQEIEWVKTLFPKRYGYLDVYDHYGLLGERSIFAHGVHLTGDECRRLAETGSVLAFCPSSNLFLGSGLFNLPGMEAQQVRVGLGSDVGAGTSFSLLRTLSDAYKVLQLQGYSLNPFKSLYLATLGGARALGLQHHIGNFEVGKEADFVVLDYQATPLLHYRMAQTEDLAERLFVLMTLGDDRTVRETFAMGRSVHQRDA